MARTPKGTGAQGSPPRGKLTSNKVDLPRLLPKGLRSRSRGRCVGFNVLCGLPPRMALDLIIRNGRLLDGTGMPWALRDVAVRKGRIVKVGDVGRARAANEIDASGKYVAPGFIDTAMTQALSENVRQELAKQIPLGKLGTPEDVANAVRFLASPWASYISGQVIHVNGGMYM